MHELIARTQQEDGFVMVIALIVVVIVLLLAASLISSGVTTSTHASKEYGRSAAIAAADAGLYAAVHRLSSQPEQTTAQQESCFTTKFVSASAKGECEGYEEAVGNSATYKYWVSPALKENLCTGLQIEAPSGRTVTQRCITSVGTGPDKTTARVQERVADLKGSLFPVKGVFSYSNLTFINKLKLATNSEFGARGTVKFNNTLEKEGHSVTVKYGEKVEKCTECTETKLTAEQLAATPYVLPEQSATPFEESRLSNSNAKIKFTPSSEGEVTANREFNANAPTTIVMPSGTYNFCSIFVKNTTTIEYAPPVTVYIDSPNRTGSACTATDGYSKKENGTVEFVNQTTWKDLASEKKVSDLSFYAWGKPKETSNKAPIFQFTNTVGGPLYAQIYAPYSYVHLTNQGKMVGAIVGGDVEFTNTVEFGGEFSAEQEPQTGTSFYAAAYHVCPPGFTESAPAEGCY